MAGLLDSLFNPSLYGGQNGGLLDFLHSTQMQQNNYQPSDGFTPQPAPSAPAPSQAQPIMVGSTQMPRIGDAAQFDPAQVNIPQNVQPTQGQVPTMPQAAASPSILDRIGSMARPDSIVGRLFGNSGANQTAQYLATKGIDLALAKTIASDPAMLRSVIPSLIGTGGKTDDIKEFEYARQFDPTLTFPKFMQQKRSTSGAYGMQGYWGTKNGKPALLQLGKDGVPVEVSLPEGFELARDPVKVDGPTGTTILDPQTRQPVGFIPKDVAGAARQAVEGKGQGEAATELASVKSKMPGLETVVKKLDGLAEKATYTIGGQIVDYSNRQAGLEPRDAAIARTEYISMVDNQILPLLRDTFGAAFTQKEGETLRATLGDPDKSPKEKQVILRSFIEQKRRDVEALEARTGRASSGQAALAPRASASTASQESDGGWADFGGVKIRKKQ